MPMGQTLYPAFSLSSDPVYIGEQNAGAKVGLTKKISSAAYAVESYFKDGTVKGQIGYGAIATGGGADDFTVRSQGAICLASNGGYRRLSISTAGVWITNIGNFDSPLYPAQFVRAWARIDFAAGTPSLTNNVNVSSITDNGVGDFTVNLTTAMPDLNGAVMAVAASEAGQACVCFYAKQTTTSQVVIKTCHSTNGAAIDPAVLNFGLVR